MKINHAVKTTFSCTNQDILPVNEYGQCSLKTFAATLFNIDKQLMAPFPGQSVSVVHSKCGSLTFSFRKKLRN